MAAITLTVAPALIREFKRKAKEAFPKETWALGLGTIAGDHVHLDEWFWPDDLDKYCTNSMVMEQEYWFRDGQAHAREEGLQSVLRMHSHPYTRKEVDHLILDRAQSEGDLDSLGSKLLVSGICVVQELKGKRLRASVRFWGPTVAVRLKEPVRRKSRARS